MKRRVYYYGFLPTIAFVLTIMVTNRNGDQWEEHVRNALYALKGDSIPDFAVNRTDSLGIPISFYPEQNGILAGEQYNATIVCNYALSYFDSLQEKKAPAYQAKFLNCVHWLQQHMTRKENYALFQFNWQQPWYDSVKAPFTSGMTSGLAMEVFSKAYTLTGQKSFLDDARLLLRGFDVSIDSGGFTYKEPAGWWYEEIADTGKHTPRILDGHLFALLGLHDFIESSRDSIAADYFAKGSAGLKHSLPAYDAGNGEICYDSYCKQADKKYKRIITAQMEKMWQITGDSLYWQYFRKWRLPMERPYILRAVKERNRSGLILLLLLFTGFAISCSLLFRAIGYFWQRQVHRGV